MVVWTLSEPPSGFAFDSKLDIQPTLYVNDGSFYGEMTHQRKVLDDNLISALTDAAGVYIKTGGLDRDDLNRVVPELLDLIDEVDFDWESAPEETGVKQAVGGEDNDAIGSPVCAVNEEGHFSALNPRQNVNA